MAKRKNKPTSSFKSLILGTKEPRAPEELPKFLKNNPHPHYINLWNQHPKLFWQEYHQDKARGTVKYIKKAPKTERLDFNDLQFKKDHKKKGKKGKRPNSQELEDCPYKDYYDQTEGFSPKASKADKLRAKRAQEEQLDHDLEISDTERDAALSKFLSKTDYNKEAPTKEEKPTKERRVAKRKETEQERLDRKTAETLK